MWFYIVIAAVIVLSLAIISSIVFKRFPQLSLIDVDSLPQEREAQKKKEILSGRIGRRFGGILRWLSVKLTPLSRFFRKQFYRAHDATAKLDKKFWGKPTAMIHPKERQEMAKKAVEEAKRFLDQGKTIEAERKYIEALSLDKNYWEIYRGLGELYMESKNYVQAREIYEYLARASLRDCCSRNRGQEHKAPADVQAKIAKNHLNLAAAYKALNNITGWRCSLETAVTHEPTNPRHLDLLLEACIMDGDKNKANQVLRLLEEANPDNHKLPQLKEEVAKMSLKDQERLMETVRDS